MDMQATGTQTDPPPAGASGHRPLRITAVIDPTTHEQPAVDKAARLAAASGARLELYSCDVEQDISESWAGPSRSQQYREMRGQRMLEELQRLAQPLRARGLAVDVASEWHAPLEEGIGHHVIRSAPGLVVKATQRRAAVARVALTRTDWNLIRQVPSQLLLVGPERWPDSPCIAAAIDAAAVHAHPPDLDEHIAGTAREMATLLGGRVEIYHVLRMPPHLPGEQVSAQQKAAAHVAARRIAHELAGRVGATATRLGEGRLVDSLAELVEANKPDMLVMGTVARPRWVHSAAGGTAAQLLERVSCDLLVVKPRGFVSPLLVTED